MPSLQHIIHSSRLFVQPALLLALFLLACGTAHADKPAIVWTQTDFPPFYIVEGPLAGQGVYDSSMPAFFALLPGFTHETKVMSIARTLEMMRSEENICSMSLLKTPERERDIAYSQPITRIFRNTLVVRRADEARLEPFTHDGQIDLDALLASRRVRLAVIRGRKYGPAIDETLARRDRAACEVVTQSAQAVRMLLSGRVDAIIAFPQEAVFALQTARELPRDALMSLPIAGTAVNVGYVGCSSSELGRRVIAAVDAPGVREKISELFASASRAWSDKNLRP